MISPEVYIEEQKNKSYEELLAERDRLISDIKQFEGGEKNEQVTEPSPDVVYQCNLKYLAKICELIAEKYNERKMGI